MHDHPSWTAMTHNKAIIKQELKGFGPTNDSSPRSYQYPQNGYCQLGHSPIGTSDIMTHANQFDGNSQGGALNLSGISVSPFSSNKERPATTLEMN